MNSRVIRTRVPVRVWAAAFLLGRHSGNISAAAREAKMDRKHLHDMAKKHGLRGNESDE